MTQYAKYKVVQDNRRYGELEIEWQNGIKLILTDSRSIHSNDWCNLKVWNVDCLDENVENIPEHIYEFSYMPDGYSLMSAIVDEVVAESIIRDNIVAILHKDSSKLKEYLESLNEKLALYAPKENKA